MNVHPKKEAAANPLQRLHRFGQAAWLDFLSRGFIANGDLRKLVEVDGLTGVTSNPSIFEKAIDGGEDYAAALEAAIRARDSDVRSLYERLAVEDIKNAADVLRPVYETTSR
jgi:transaldolase/glucose-6-phosphate isomerase